MIISDKFKIIFLRNPKCASSSIRDILFEFDYEAYHPRILAKFIEYEFGKESVHEYLGKMYFKTDNLTEEQYQQSKELTFKQLYGGVF